MSDSEPSKISVLAIISLVLGVVAMFFTSLIAPIVVGLLGLVAGIVAVRQIGGSDGRLQGKAVAIGGVVISLIALVLGPTSAIQAQKKAAQKAEEAAKTEAVRKIFLERNVKLAKEEYDKAEQAGLKFVQGLETKDKDDQSLFEPFKNDDKIYNVVFDRHYKEKGKNGIQKDVRVMYPERPSSDTVAMDYPKGKEGELDGLTVKYGLAKGNVPIVIGIKEVAAPPKATDNTGGNIIISVKSDGKDPAFKHNIRGKETDLKTAAKADNKADSKAEPE